MKFATVALALAALGMLGDAAARTAPAQDFQHEVKAARSASLSMVVSAACVAKSCRTLEYVLAGGQQRQWRLQSSSKVPVGSLVYVMEGEADSGTLFAVEAVPRWEERDHVWRSEYWVLIPEGYNATFPGSVPANAGQCALQQKGLNVLGPGLCRFRAAVRLQHLLRVRPLSPGRAPGSRVEARDAR